MKRRDFLGAALVTGVGASALSRQASLSAVPGNPVPSVGSLAGIPLKALYAECKRQLFEGYLPFWENGGHDAVYGGFMCLLHEDGSIEDDRKDIWYQGRGIWVYSTLYNTLDKDPRWLERARLARDFMVHHMHRGDGTWLNTVNRAGEPVSTNAVMRSNSIYGALFAAAGLIQYAKATGSVEDINLARLSLRKSVELYEDPNHIGVEAPGVDVPGLRAQGCSFMMVWVIPQFLELQPDPFLEGILEEHLDALENRFWNSEYGISNEILYHDYSRIPELVGQMVPGHSIEAQWMCMEEAIRKGDSAGAAVFASRMSRLIEMSWDYVFDGTCDTDYHVFATDRHPAGPELDIKTMWAQTEVAIGCIKALRFSGEPWAADWFNRSWQFLQRTMTTDFGVWRQAVDRRGNDKEREGISPYRRGNFHQPRCLMYVMLELERLRA